MPREKIPEVTQGFDTAWDEDKNGGQLKRGAPAGYEPTDAPTIGSHGGSHERRHCHSTKRQSPPFLALRSSGVPFMKTKTTTEPVQ